MKKISILLISLIILAIPVLALNSMVQTQKIGDKNYYNIGVKVEKGWNLLVGVSPELVIHSRIRDNGGDIQEENIKVIYIFNPKNQEYVQWYPNPETEKLRQIQNDNLELDILSSSFWVYSDKTGYLKFKADKILDLDKRNLFEGWNFVGITPEFLNKQLSELKGNCDIQGAYYYKNRLYLGHETPSWERIYDDVNFMPFIQEAQATGIIIKVNGACKLGTPSANITPPPILPA